MKKIRGIFLVTLLLLSFLFTACSKADTQTTGGSKDAASKTTVTPAATPGQTSASPTNAASEYEIPEVEISPYEIPDTEAFQFVKDMKIGWNLGNTFDANTEVTIAGDELEYETMWTGAKTTQEMMDALKNAGFNAVRIPVSWHNHVSGDDFTISEVWLNRVQEVVDYAYKNGMYVILNTHHDIGEGYYYPDSAHLDNSKKYIEKIWTQLAARFADYDEHLIYESLNEPRLVGSNYEWWLDTNNASCIDAIQCINTLNQVFVDTVRNNEGNNNERYLMVPGYDASAQGALVEGFSLPKDVVADKLIVSVHAYTPYNFALQAQSEKGSIYEFSSDNPDSVKEIDQFMDQLYNKFISAGVPVVIGEFGARDKYRNIQDRIDYATYYIAAARARGMSCFWWDNDSFLGSGENFGLMERKSTKIIYPDIVEGLMKYTK